MIQPMKQTVILLTTIITITSSWIQLLCCITSNNIIVVEAWSITKVRIPSFRRKHIDNNNMIRNRQHSSIISSSSSSDNNNKSIIQGDGGEKRKRFKKAKEIMKVPFRITKRKQRQQHELLLQSTATTNTTIGEEHHLLFLNDNKINNDDDYDTTMLENDEQQSSDNIVNSREESDKIISNNIEDIILMNQDHDNNDDIKNGSNDILKDIIGVKNDNNNNNNNNSNEKKKLSTFYEVKAPSYQAIIDEIIQSNWNKTSIASKTNVMKQSKRAKVITNIEELRSAVLDQGILLQDLEFNVTSFQSSTKNDKPKYMTTPKKQRKIDHEIPFDHEVIKLIEKRFKTNSKPSARASDDTAHLSLSIEGGGMRGAVSAGMASAIVVLGLTDTFDSIYGSSAGSVIGAYMVSRQMCIDVYTQVLTAAKTKFVCKTRLISSLASNLLDQALNNTIFSKNLDPAMNISFVLDNIMDPEHGLRPLDMETFRLNDQKQQLRIVTSCMRGGRMETHCLGSRTMDFFDTIHNETGAILERATTMVDGKRHGLFACLETSMTVPAATGPPLPLLRNKDIGTNLTTRCFDAFCYEPIPYRSAVEEGATHVLVLKSRPEGNPIGTTPGLFEKVFAPMYFDANEMPEVSKYFENGGQQYIYAEDYLTLDEGKKSKTDKVKVPPRKILYGVERDEEAKSLIENRDEWKTAHLLPISVPSGTPELSTLSVDTIEVLEAVQHGFATAFDLLAPSTGIELNSHLNGKRVAELIFASNVTAGGNYILQNPISIAGDPIMSQNHEIQKQQHNMSMMSLQNEQDNDKFEPFFPSQSTLQQKLSPTVTTTTNNNNMNQSKTENKNKSMNHCPKEDSFHLLERLPGLSNGKMNSLSSGLYHHISKK